MAREDEDTESKIRDLRRLLKSVDRNMLRHVAETKEKFSYFKQARSIKNEAANIVDELCRSYGVESEYVAATP
jgi:hypothetical protein